MLIQSFTFKGGGGHGVFMCYNTKDKDLLNAGGGFTIGGWTKFFTGRLQGVMNNVLNLSPRVYMLLIPFDLFHFIKALKII